MSRLIQVRTKASEYDGEFRWQAAGMSYLIVNGAHEYAVIDGGQELSDIDELYRLMREDCGHDAVTVKYWFITHPHADHYRALQRLAESGPHTERIKVGKLIFSVPETFRVCVSDLGILRSLPGKLGAEYVEPAAGDVLGFGDLTFRILATWRDVPDPYDPNELSMILSAEGRRKKAMFTGDAYRAGLSALVRRLREAGETDLLKSDIVQVAHHGLNGGDVDFYHYVGAETAMVPISKSGYLAINAPRDRCCTANRFAQDRALTVIYSFAGNYSAEL
ncbi:MAG: MBL fold metallo-hydrolase [Clostridia bacterium]|nr:MBL fold metallo-hydrolase [Clostridia bacterium]